MTVNKDNFIPFVSSILPDPVRIEDFHVRVSLRGTFFCNPSDTLASRYTVDAHPRRAAGPHIPCSPPASTADCYTHNDDALFGLEPEGPCPVNSCRMFNPDNASLSSPDLHPLPLKGADTGFIGFFPCVSHVRIHRFCHNDSPRFSSLSSYIPSRDGSRIPIYFDGLVNKI